MMFDLQVPTGLTFGRGRLSELGRVTARHGHTALIVTGRSAMRRTGTLDRTAEALKAAGVEPVVFEGVSPNPRSDETDAAIALARRSGCDVVIGLGGASALDAAKAVAVGFPYASVADLIGKTLEHRPDTLPMIAVPTTTGAGAEVTRGAILVDVRRNFRSGIRGEDVSPRHAIVDPDLSAGLPGRVAVESAFDSLAHAVEGYLARKANPVTDLLCEKVIRTVGEHIISVADGIADPVAHEALCLAGLLGGMSVANASTCLPHRMQQAMGVRPDGGTPPHARGLAILYPAWVELVQDARPERSAHIASWVASTDLTSYFGQLLPRIGMATSLGDWAYTRQDISQFMAGISGNVDNDPLGQFGDDIVRTIYEKSLA
ncbi:iron-containing alcohol dehydrogenase [Streptomyces sp. NPDC026294]|uniref:iron-containing alcohol dehydrogenase n=1 Tax=Streptomyces sp. NPDC026294 TaxID=3155362 RepID=UPI0033E21BF3